MTLKARSMSEIVAPAAEPIVETKSAPAPVVAEELAEKTLPDKYDGKTVAEVADMHMNAEQELGRVRNENHTYRGLVSDLTALSRPQPELETKVQEPIDVSGDDLIQDPVGTIRKVVAQDLAEVRAEGSAQVLAQQVQTEELALARDYGDIDNIVKTSEFQSFALRTPSRQADFNTAAIGEGLDQVRAARRLLEDFADFQEVTKAPEEKIELTPVEQAKLAATEGAGPAGSITTKTQIFESDVIKMVTADPLKYRSPSFQAELSSAIKEGRFVKIS